LHYRQDNANSSVNSAGKIYCVCDEYNEIQRYLDANVEKKSLYPIMNRMRFDSYMWNMGRISEEFVPEFAKRMSEDFRAAAAGGQLNKLQFEPWKWEQLTRVASLPGDFAQEFIVERRNASINEKIEKIQEAFNNKVTQTNMKNLEKNGLIRRLCSKVRTAIFILRHEGIKGVIRTVKEKI